MNNSCRDLVPKNPGDRVIPNEGWLKELLAFCPDIYNLPCPYTVERIETVISECKCPRETSSQVHLSTCLVPWNGPGNPVAVVTLRGAQAECLPAPAIYFTELEALRLSATGGLAAAHFEAGNTGDTITISVQTMAETLSKVHGMMNGTQGGVSSEFYVSLATMFQLAAEKRALEHLVRQAQSVVGGMTDKFIKDRTELARMALYRNYLRAQLDEERQRSNALEAKGHDALNMRTGIGLLAAFLSKNAGPRIGKKKFIEFLEQFPQSPENFDEALKAILPK